MIVQLRILLILVKMLFKNILNFIMASLDVDSFFTNVPYGKTINKCIKNIMNIMNNMNYSQQVKLFQALTNNKF